MLTFFYFGQLFLIFVDLLQAQAKVANLPFSSYSYLHLQCPTLHQPLQQKLTLPLIFSAGMITINLPQRIHWLLFLLASLFHFLHLIRMSWPLQTCFLETTAATITVWLYLLFLTQYSQRHRHILWDLSFSFCHSSKHSLPFIPMEVSQILYRLVMSRQLMPKERK